MNSGVFSPQDASGSPAASQVFCETVQLSAVASSARQTFSISPRPGVSTHYLLISGTTAANNSGVCRIAINGAFPEGYSIVLMFDLSGATRAPHTEVFADGATIYIAPRPLRSVGEAVTLVRACGAWRRVSVCEEIRQPNSLISNVQATMSYRGLGTATGTATNSGTQNASQVVANGTVANSTAMRYGNINNTAQSDRGIMRSIFNHPFAIGMVFDSSLSSGTSVASATAIMRMGVIAAFQSIASDGTPSAVALGFQINNLGDWFGFYHNGTAMTTTSLSFNQGDLGGGQGAPNIQCAVAWSPAGVAEWSIAGFTRLRQEGLAYSLPAGGQYSSFYFSAATGASTGTGNVSLTFQDARYYSI